ncbi:uncharacterized protein LOC103182485 [Callorhinchus milii]|uniref:Transmembrane protein n=1 Tax=Callorhinchus milii TaxID=7868 RepID=K4FT10_CALMI|nr:uncharacterized protein LOC103182485 [Callorhinchus milii]AFK10830.1 transmembrane protein [Callorhinchus milii]|eukprot:gi/632937220/ref/XP_007897730.1/ PREDICTED: transmembrane protein 150A-like [Callorhinchus milii]
MGCWVLLPLLTGIVSIAGTWTVYGIALAHGHVCPLTNWEYNYTCPINTTTKCCTEKNMPYVSTSGVRFPENSLYSAVLNAVAFLFVVLCVFRHAQIVEQKGDEMVLSKVALIMGCFASVGGFLAGNCNLFAAQGIHYFGASLCFVAACFYAVLQTVLTYKVRVTGKECFLAPLRTVLVIIEVLFSIIFVAFIIHPVLNYRHVGAIAEWVVCTNFHIFVMTLAFEFFSITSSVLHTLINKPEDEKVAILSDHKGTGLNTFNKLH